MTAEVLAVMADLASSGQTMVVVSHAMGFVRRSAHRVHVLADGQVIEQFMEHSSGSRGQPMTQAQIDAKFLDCAAQIVPEDAGRRLDGRRRAVAYPLLRSARNPSSCVWRTASSARIGDSK